MTRDEVRAKESLSDAKSPDDAWKRFTQTKATKSVERKIVTSPISEPITYGLEIINREEV